MQKNIYGITKKTGFVGKQQVADMFKIKLSTLRNWINNNENYKDSVMVHSKNKKNFSLRQMEWIFKEFGVPESLQNIVNDNI